MKFASTALALLAIQPSLAQDVYDAIVIGGGLSGLSAAKKLSEAGKRFLVLEARNRVGGRTYTVELENGGYADLGGTFLDPTQNFVVDLADDLGIELFLTLDTGNNILFHRGEISLYEAQGPLGAIPPIDPVSLLQVLEAQAALTALAATIDVSNPWNSPGAKVLDALSLADFLKARLLTESATFLIETIMHSIFSVETDEQSLLFTAAYVAAAGNETEPGSMDRLVATTGGAQMFRIDGGAETIARRLADKIGRSNILLSSPVASVTETGSGYDVKTVSGEVFQAEHVIVAMSPPVADLIEFSPPLPAQRQGLQKEMPMGSLGKGIGIYETPFWAAENLTGQVVSDAGLGRVLYDQSARDGSYGAVMAFIEADEMREYVNATDEEIADVIRSDFVNYFGPQANNAIEWVVFVWDREEYSLGGPTAIAPVGVYTEYGPALKNSVGNIHFAGTEASDYWIGYMDGAVRAGYYAAAKVS